MDRERLDRLVELSHEDTARGETRRAKDRLRSVLQASPHFQPALELMGHIHYLHADYRNAAMYWSRAEYWSNPMPQACERVFRSIGRALSCENSGAARYHLCAFAGTSLPADLTDKLSLLQTAYYGLNKKRARLAGLACAPLCGGCLIGLLGVTAALLSPGWSWFIWMGTVAALATAVVMGINAWSYYRAARLLRDAIASFQTRGNQ